MIQGGCISFCFLISGELEIRSGICRGGNRASMWPVIHKTIIAIFKFALDAVCLLRVRSNFLNRLVSQGSKERARRKGAKILLVSTHIIAAITL